MLHAAQHAAQHGRTGLQALTLTLTGIAERSLCGALVKLNACVVISEDEWLSRLPTGTGRVCTPQA